MIGNNHTFHFRTAALLTLLLSMTCASCSRSNRSDPGKPTAMISAQTSPAPVRSQSASALQASPRAGAVLVQAPPVGEPPADAQKPDRVFENGHTSAVTALAFTADGRWIASGGQDKTIRIWEIATGREQRILTGHTNAITALAFSPNGQELASSSEDGTVRMWDPATGTSSATSSLGAGFAEDVVFSPDGRFWVASAGAADEGGNSVIAIYDAISGEKIHAISIEWNNAMPVVITPDDRILSSGGAGEDGEYVSTKVWELKSGRELKTLPVLMMAFTSDGHWGLSVEYKQGAHVNLWDITSGRHVRTITVPYIHLAQVAFTPDGTEILAAEDNGSEIKFYETATGKEVRTLPFSSGAIAFSCGRKVDGGVFWFIGQDL